MTKDCGKDCASDAALGAAVVESLDFLTLEENACLWFGFCDGPSKIVERVGKTGRLLTAKGKLDARALPEPAALLETSFLKALYDDRVRATRASEPAEGSQAPAVAAAPEHKPAAEPAPKERVYSYTAGAARTGTPVGTLELPNVAFSEASHALNDEGRAKVGLIAETLRGFPALCVRIVGHTNSTGDKEANRGLSKSRALAIAEQLTRIDPTVFPKERFDVQGMGSDRPVLVNSVEDKIASRRTDFTLIDCAD